jgi:type IV pilus assembly protein PilM
MARRLIGLDVGTNAVTIAEVTPGTPPRLDMFAQVALARSAMREGEIADEAAVTDAVTRLRSEVGIKKVPVRVGIASPRVVVRQVEMPVMTRDELAGALQFQAGDLIPIPMDDAVLDFAILGTSPSGGENGEPTMQVLLAAAYQATVSRLVSAVEAGGLTVAAVDLVPLALTRALARPVGALARVGAAVGDTLGDDAPGAEGIVSFGGGVTSIAVHEAGIARFVRVIGSGGRELTDAIATDLNVPAETAEALKRQVGMPSNDELVARARTSIDRPLSVLLDEVRSSIDYYRNQPGAARLLRVVATGGSAQLPGIPERLSALVGVPVEHASMRDLLRVGNIGFSPDELPRIEPYLPAAVGLALGGAGVGTVIDLLPRARKTAKKARPQFDKRIVLAGAAALVVLGGLTYLGEQKVSSAKSKQSTAEANVKKLESAIARLTPAPGAAGSSASLQAEALALLQANVGWPHSIGSVGKALPSGVWLTAFQGQQSAAPVAAAVSSPASGGTTSGDGAATSTDSSPAATGVTALGASGSCAPLSGSITMSGIATDLPTLAHFLDNMKSNKAITNVWVASAQKADFGTQSMITFTANATLGDGARSARITDFFKGASCK